MTSYLERITFDHDKRNGKPCVRGLRIAVDDVLEWMRCGMNEKEILEDFLN